MGPGCPVCTVPPNRIDFAIRLAESGVILTTFGDMMRVPAGLGSLADAKARGPTSGSSTASTTLPRWRVRQIKKSSISA